MNQTFKTLVLLALASGLAACGQDRSGTYRGTETTQTTGNYYQYGYQYGYGQYQQNGQNGQVPSNQNLTNQQSSDVTITLNHQDGDKVTGTWVSINGTGNFTGTLDDTQITNVNLTLAGVNNGSQYGNPYGMQYGNQYGNQYGYPQQYQYGGGASYGCSNTYTGTLSIKDDQLSGILINAGTQNCPGTSKSVSAKKQ